MTKRLAYLLLVMMLMAACSSIDCPVNNTVATLYQIRNSDGTDINILDSALYNKGIGISSFSLPISYLHPEDVLVFKFDNSNKDLHVADTVWIKKDDYPHFESVDCNTSYFHTLTGVKYTSHYIDSIVIKNPSVTYDYETVHLYLYPKSNN